MILRIVMLLVLAGLTVSIVYVLVDYELEPITRDGEVRADIIPIASDVGGFVTEVRVRDNQPVRRGDVLMVIDQPRYKLAVEQAQANLERQQAVLAEAIQEDRRNHTLANVVSRELVEQSGAKVTELRGEVAADKAVLGLARFNLKRTLVRAPVDGTVTNSTLQPGVFLAPGTASMALIYDRSLRVEGYFEETKLQAVHVGDPASIWLMGVNEEIRGTVDSIEAGVESRARSDKRDDLANVDPTFTYVRRAQRIPVRVNITYVPPHVHLVPGLTATVEVHPRPGETMPRISIPW